MSNCFSGETLDLGRSSLSRQRGDYASDFCNIREFKKIPDVKFNNFHGSTLLALKGP